MLNNAIASRKSDNLQNVARPIGQLSGTRKFRGSVGVGDKTDFYSFTLTGRSSFNLSLNKLKNNVDVFLQQGKQVIARSTKGGKKTEAISTILESGTYYVRVNQKNGNSKYKLTLNAAPTSSSGTDPDPNKPNPAPVGSRFLSFEGGIARLDPSSGKMSILYKRDPAQVPEQFTDIAAFGNEIFASTSKGLYKIDANTGSPSFVGNLSGNRIEALGFTPSGDLYGVGGSIGDKSGLVFGLFSINRTNGTTLTVGSSDSDFTYIKDIAYDSASSRFLAFSHYVAAEKFYTIGLAGDINSVYSNVYAYDGLAFDNGKWYAYRSVDLQDEIRPTDGTYITSSVDPLVFEPLQPMGTLGYITGAA
jgi:hypothetical protein